MTAGMASLNTDQPVLFDEKTSLSYPNEISKK